MKPLKYSLIVFLLCLTGLASLAGEQYSIERLSNENGLSNSSVNCFCEDSRHRLWIGTWDGLNVYDGRKFQIYRHKRNFSGSLGNNIIRQIIEQDSLTMWIVTNDCVSRRDERTGQFSNFYPGRDNNAKSGPVSYILGKTSGNDILVCAKQHGFFLYRQGVRESGFIPVVGGDPRVLSMLIDNTDRIYMLTESREIRCYRFIYLEGRELPMLVEGSPVKTQCKVSDISLTDNMLVINCGNIVEGLDLRTGERYEIETGLPNVGKIASRGGFLYLTDSNYSKLVRYDLRARHSDVIDSFPTKTAVFSLYAGSQDILWIGTDGRGILKLFKYASPFMTIHTVYPVRCFSKGEDGTILVGTKGEGIKLFDKRKRDVLGEITATQGLISNSVYSMRKNSRGDIFIGTEGKGINYLVRGEKSLRKLYFPADSITVKSVYSLNFSHGDSVLWAGTSGGGLIRMKLKYLRGDGYTVYDVRQYKASGAYSALGSNVIYSIVRSVDQDVLWLGTRGGGVVKFDPGKERFESIPNYSDLSKEINMDVLSMVRGTDGSLWVGTSYGLNRLMTEEGQIRYTSFPGEDDLEDSAVHGIVEDMAGNLWISTGNGITCIDGHSGRSVQYTSLNGLQNNEFSDGAYFRDNDKDIFFGGVAGFSYFNPDEMSLRDYSPQIRLAGLRINNAELNVYDRIKQNVLCLDYDEAHVSLSFCVGDFINNENCIFEYRISSISDEWISNGSNSSISLTRLPPGRYRLDVRYTNGDRVWCKSMFSLNIRMRHPWWFSGWAVIIYLMLAIFIAYVVCSMIRNRIRMSRRLLLEHVEKEQQKKMHESQLNFFENIAHEFFTPLTLIYGPAQQLLERGELDNYAKKYVLLIKNNAERMQQLLNELMAFRKADKGYTVLHAETLNLNSMLNSIIDNFMLLAGENHIQLSVRIGEMGSFNTDRNVLEKIFFNLISNAFKYTPANGYIKIYLERQADDTVQFRVRNSGKGLTEEQCAEAFNRFRIFEHTNQKHAISTGIGLNLAKELSELLGGKISVESQLNEYVEFNVVLPQLPMPEKQSEEDPRKDVTFNLPVSQDRHRKFTVLVVEDDYNIRDLLLDILSSKYTVLTANDGLEALRILQQNLPDLVLCDIVMPELDGLGLIDKIRSDERTAHLPIVSVSAKLSMEDRIEAVEHGADAYITKPFNPRHVLATIGQLLNKRTIMKEYFNSARSDVTVREGVTLHHEDERLLNDIVGFIEKNIDDDALNPTSISDFIGMGKTSLYEKLKELTGKTPGEYIRMVRLDHASKLLKTTQLTVQEVMYKSGFSSKSYFYKEFAARFGSSPKEYRKANSL
ncbi:MAG: response regulator [Bacteroidales bacterium]|nr:response regulator [Bacteroidales bacterium]